jgi:hypothetical protein
MTRFSTIFYARTGASAAPTSEHTWSEALAFANARSRGKFATGGNAKSNVEPTFGSAALAYMQFGGESRPLKRLISHFKDTPLSRIDQAAIDAAAAALYPWKATLEPRACRP